MLGRVSANAQILGGVTHHFSKYTGFNSSNDLLVETNLIRMDRVCLLEGCCSPSLRPYDVSKLQPNKDIYCDTVTPVKCSPSQHSSKLTHSTVT